MNIFHRRQVQTLSEWLEIATRKLTDASKERIRLEIDSHYADAVGAHREDGLSEADAQTKALTELGAPKTAARRFRKQHLTEREDQRLKNSEKMARSIWWLIFSFVFFGQFAFDRHNLVTHYWYKWLSLVLAFVFLVALPTVRFAITRFSGAKSNGHLLVPDPWFIYIMGISLDRLFTTGLSHFEVYLNALCGLSFLIYYLLGIRIWIKLGKLAPIGSPTAPPDSAPA